MAIDDDAVLNPAIGHYYYAPTAGQARPSDPLAPASPWVDLGHTSLDDPFGLTSEGGDTTTLGTWQNKNLRNVTSPRVESVTFQVMQWDSVGLKLYYGSNAAVSGGNVRVPKSPQETEGALFVLVEDGLEQVAMYWPKVSIYRADDLSFDPEALAGLPVRATVLETSGQDWLYEVTPKGDLSVP